MNLEIGLQLASLFHEKAVVIHSDKLADVDTIDTITSSLNVDIQDHYIQNLLAANLEALQKTVEKFNHINAEVEYSSVAGDPVEVLLNAGKDSDADLLIIGHNDNKNILEEFWGGVTESILNQYNKSVLVVKNFQVKNPKKILVTYDFSHHCEEALNWAKKFANVFESEITLVNIVPCYYEGYHAAHAYSSALNSAMETVIDASVVDIKEKLDVIVRDFGSIATKVKSEVIIDKEGSISDQILEYAKNNKIDLIIMGTHKRGRIRKFILGSSTNRVLKGSQASVLIAK